MLMPYVVGIVLHITIPDGSVPREVHVYDDGVAHLSGELVAEKLYRGQD